MLDPDESELEPELIVEALPVVAAEVPPDDCDDAVVFEPLDPSRAPVVVSHISDCGVSC